MTTMATLILAVSMAGTGGLRDRLSGHGIFPIFPGRRPDLAAGPGAGLGIPQRQPRWLRLGRLRYLPSPRRRPGRPTTSPPRYFMSPAGSGECCRSTSTRTSPEGRGSSPTPIAAVGILRAGTPPGSAMTPSASPITTSSARNPVVKPPAFTGRDRSQPRSIRRIGP